MRRYSSSKYPQYEFKKGTVKNWKTKYEQNFRKEKTSDFFFYEKGWQSDEILTEIKPILNNLHIPGAAITLKVVIAVGNGMVSARCPEKMAKNGGCIIFLTKWARNVLQSLDWVKRTATTTKKEMIPALYEELTFFGGRKIAQIFLDHNIHGKLY